MFNRFDLRPLRSTSRWRLSSVALPVRALRPPAVSQHISIYKYHITPRPNIFCDPSYVPDSSKYTQTPDMSALSDACYLLLQNRTRCVMRGSTHAFVMCLKNSNRLENVSVCNAVFLYCILKYIIKWYIFYCKNNIMHNYFDLNQHQFKYNKF